LFFGSAFRSQWFQPFATHPPLAARIKRIDPQFDGRFPRTVPQQAAADRGAARPAAATKPAPAPRGPLFGRRGWAGATPLDPLLVLASVGVPTIEDAQYAAQMIASIPAPLAEAIRDPWAARAVVFAMLFDPDSAIRDRQRRLLQEREGQATDAQAAKLAPLIIAQGSAQQLPLVEFVQGTLRELSEPQYHQFRETVELLVAVDSKVSLFEFFLKRVLLGHLDRALLGNRPPPVRFHAMQGVLAEASCLLSLTAHAGQRDSPAAQQAFEHGAAALQVDTMPAMLTADQCALGRIDEALQKLAAASPAIKRRVLNATIVAVATDREVTVAEAELLRAIADSLDCPMPPLAIGSIPRGG
jgi:hypothetical protein